MPKEAANITGAQGQPGKAKARVELAIGGMSNELQARQEAREFKNPQVFRNRSAFFPNPQNFGLQITVVSSTPYQWPKPPSPMNQFYVELVLDIEAPAIDRIEEWTRRVNQAIKVFMPSSYGETSERARHLQETGRENPVTGGVAAPSKTYTGSGGEREAHLRERGIAPPVKEGGKREPTPETPPAGPAAAPVETMTEVSSQ